MMLLLLVVWVIKGNNNLKKKEKTWAASWSTAFAGIKLAFVKSGRSPDGVVLIDGDSACDW